MKIGCKVEFKQYLKHNKEKTSYKIDTDTVQVFITPSTKFLRKPLTNHKEIAVSLQRNGIKQMAIHSSYLINLSKSIEENEKGINSLLLDIKDSDLIQKQTRFTKIIGIVIHMGKAVNGMSKEIAINNYIANLTFILGRSKKTKIPILLETSAGQGNEIGYNLSEFIYILNSIPKKFSHRVGCCLDTCHIFAAGEYDISKDSKLYFETLKEKLNNNMNLVKLIHMNDSKVEFGRRVDRHESLGKGFFVPNTYDNPHPALVEWVKFAKQYDIPIILETNKKFHKKEIEHLRYIERGV